ncbi:MAG TPA: VVA0879 family protein [Anaerovoracaceae bacterium]|nr:VVA0879 family protein [Anaerovoracaceae bacterium]
MNDKKTYTYADWKAEGVKRFGQHTRDWRFKCCNCGHEQSIRDFEEAGIAEPNNKVYFSCIGRWTKGEGTIGNGKSPCDYTIGGLLNFATTSVVDEDGNVHWVFAFGEPT